MKGTDLDMLLNRLDGLNKWMEEFSLNLDSLKSIDTHLENIGDLLDPDFHDEKIIQIITQEDCLTALTDRGRVFEQILDAAREREWRLVSLPVFKKPL